MLALQGGPSEFGAPVTSETVPGPQGLQVEEAVAPVRSRRAGYPQREQSKAKTRQVPERGSECMQTLASKVRRKHHENIQIGAGAVVSFRKAQSQIPNGFQISTCPTHAALTQPSRSPLLWRLPAKVTLHL
jgi:hypothetical protein